MTGVKASPAKWKVEACRCRECTLIPGAWFARGPELGQVSEWASWDAAYRYAKLAADNHWTKAAAEEARLEREDELDDIVGFDGAVWVGSREFKVPAAWRQE